MGRMIQMLAGVNLVGAVTTFFYFAFVQADTAKVAEAPGYYDLIFFVLGCGVLALSFMLFRRRRVKPVREVADGIRPISDYPPEVAHGLRHAALELPKELALISFGVWLGAGFLFSFIHPLLREWLFQVPIPELGVCMMQFAAIAFLGGGVTSLVLFFLLEYVWRPKIPLFFPQGGLRQMNNGFRMSVRRRLLVVLMGIVLIPLPVVGSILNANLARVAGVDLGGVWWELTYVSADLLCITLILAVLLNKSICDPLEQIHAAVDAVAEEDLSVRVEVQSNDEFGDVAEGINTMVDRLAESRRTRDSFGRYLSREIRDEILAGRVAMDGEMKRVTLLFSDLRQFTGLVEEHHPRQVVEILNQYFDEMHQAIRAHGGLILQFVGDEIEAVFGAPAPCEDHPEMAVQAALEMRSRMAALNARLKDQGMPGLHHGIGIHSGAVLAGNIGSKERMSYSLVGDTVNTASRIEGLSKVYGADILLSQTTHNLLTRSYDTEQLEPVQVKGKAQRLIVYRLNA